MIYSIRVKDEDGKAVEAVRAFGGNTFTIKKEDALVIECDVPKSEALRLDVAIGIPFQQSPKMKQELLSLSLKSLGFDARAVNALEKKGIITLEQLIQHTAPQILHIPQVGRKTLEKTEARLTELGCSLKT